MLAPSNPDYNFNIADVAQAGISPAQAGQIILNATGGSSPVSASSPDGTAALLAAILKSQQKVNSQYQPFPFSYAIWNQQQVLGKNPNRAYLLIQNVGSGDLLVVFEESSITTEDFSATANDQQVLTIKQSRAVRIVAGGSYEPLVPPTNALTLFTLNTATFGLVIEGA